MSRSNSLLVSAFVVLLTDYTGYAFCEMGAIQGQCNMGEQIMLMQCAAPYIQRIVAALGTDGPCDRTIIKDRFCSDYAAGAACFNEASVSRKTCRPSAVAEMEQILDFSCKAVDFIEACPEAPELDTGN